VIDRMRQRLAQRVQIVGADEDDLA
jgi:hypothetical protein